jgi:hypothetical protein
MIAAGGRVWFHRRIWHVVLLAGGMAATGTLPTAAQEKARRGSSVAVRAASNMTLHRSDDPEGAPRAEPTPASLALLRKVESYVRAGNVTAARNAAQRIPEPEWRDSALSIIASSQATQKDFAGAKQTVQAMRYPLHRTHTLTFIAGTEEMHSFRAEARQTRAAARKIALSISHVPTRDAALSRLSDAYLRSGDLTTAKQLAVRIHEPRRRFLPLARIARRMAETGNLAGAKKTIVQAREAAGRGKPGYARDTFLKEAFFVETRVGDLDGAVQTAREMYDPFARTSTLAEVAVLVARTGSRAAARRAIQEALTAFPLIQYSYAKDSARLLLVRAQVSVGDIAEAKRTAAAMYDPQKKEQAQQEIARGRQGASR